MRLMNSVSLLKMTFKYTSLFFLLFVSNPTQSQITNCAINAIRYNDDFQYLKGDSLKHGLDKLKYINIGGNANVSFGGELREQYQYFRNQNFGDVPPSFERRSTGQLLHRLMLHSNIEIGSKTRFFIQLSSTFRLFNPNPISPEVDENQLSLHQAFVDYSFNKNLKVRLGRQELGYGSYKILTFREGANTRLTFDGVIVKYKSEKRNIDVLFVTPVVSNRYVFDDQSFKEFVFGIYGTEFFASKKLTLDYYVLGFNSNKRKYNYVSGKENRQIIGFRLLSRNPALNYELESNYQTGTFNQWNISAYGISGNVRYKMVKALNLTVGVNVNYFSGDGDKNDDELNTYNSLFSKPLYGSAAPIGSSNILNFNPYLQLNPIKKLSVYTGVYILKRQSNQDGSYSPAMSQVRPASSNLFTSKAKDIGVEYSLETNYEFNPRTSFALDATFIKAGKYVKETGNGLNVGYVSGKATFKF